MRANQETAQLAPILDDQPAEKDLLDFDSYVEALQELIVHPDTETPLTLGVFGRWGTGKTTLMRMLERALRAEGIATVWFNAWQYGKEDELWAAFLQSILNRMEAQLSLFYRLSFRLGLLFRRVEWRSVPGFLAQLLFKILIVSIPLLLVGPVTEQLDPEAETLVRAGGGLTTAALAVWVVIKPFVEAVRENVTLDLSPLQQTSDYQEHIAFLDRFREHFEDVVQSLPQRGKKRLCVFIDDLDRCSPERTLEVLDAIKLFVDIKGCVYVLGLDLDIVQKAVATKYKDDPLAQKEYLGKIIQLPFQLPPLTRDEMEAFLRELDLQLPGGCDEVFVKGLVVNPREVKRSINIFSLLWTLAHTREELTAKIKPVRLAKVVVIQHGHPELHKLLVGQPQLLARLERYYRQMEETRADVGSEEPEREYLTQLREILSSRFNLEELRTLCFDLDVDYENLSGEGLTAKARELVAFLENRGRLSALIEWMKQGRPDIDLTGIDAAIEAAERARAAMATLELPAELQPFIQRDTLRQMLLLNEGQADATFADLAPEEIQVYFTLTSRAEAVPEKAFEPAAPADVVGDRYRILQEMRKGWMSTVYLAEDRAQRQRVVLKVMTSATTQDPVYVNQFKLQIDALYRLEHPNIVRILDDGTYGDAPFLAMEYLSGGSLRRSIQLDGRLPLAATLRVMLPILDALGSTHLAGYVHGNVRPEVILFDAGGIPKLTGFSIVRPASEALPKGYVLGTPPYMSPEQSIGLSDTRTDLYAFGVVLYECLAGQVPFEEGTRAAQMKALAAEGPPPSPRTLNPDIPEALDAVIMKLLEPSPDDRYARAETVRDELLQAAGDVGLGEELLAKA
jgi:hypothetical protein